MLKNKSELIQSGVTVFSLLFAIYLLISCNKKESIGYKDSYLEVSNKLQSKNNDYNDLVNKYNSLVEKYNTINTGSGYSTTSYDNRNYNYSDNSQYSNDYQSNENDLNDKITNFMSAGKYLDQDISFKGKINSISSNDYYYVFQIGYRYVYTLKSDYQSYVESGAFNSGTRVSVICSKTYSAGYKDCNISLD
jgi:hypothetical protein